MNKTYLLSAIALGAMVITWAPVEARADSLACSQASAKALQQRAAAGKCDPHSGLSPQMQAALAIAGHDKSGGANEEADDTPKQEASNGEGGEDAGDEGGAGGAGGADGGGKGKKLPGDKIVQKHPGGDINIGDKPVVKKQPKDGDIIIAEKIEELEFGQPDKPKIAIAEEVEELEFGEPEKPIKVLVEPKDPIRVLVEPEDNIKVLVEPKDPIRVLVEPEDNVKVLVEPKDPIKVLVEPKKESYHDDHAGKGGKDNGGGKGDKGGKESKGAKGGNGIAG